MSSMVPENETSKLRPRRAAAAKLEKVPPLRGRQRTSSSASNDRGPRLKTEKRGDGG